MSTMGEIKNIGGRIKEERERLGMTQEAFAKECGVGRTAQFNYERGERRPTSGYLGELDRIGADSRYVMTGVRGDDDWRYARAYKMMLLSIERLLGLNESLLDPIANLWIESERDLAEAKGMVEMEPYHLALLNWLKGGKLLEVCIDQDLLAATMTAFEEGVARTHSDVTPAKKSAAILMLYRSFKAGGAVDSQLVDAAVRLASV